MSIPEIEELKSQVEQKYGRTLSTTTDFEEFSLVLDNTLPQSISASTLKRIWGYVNDRHKTRKYTLDILAQYIGFGNFDKFVSWLKTSTKYNSSFFNASQLTSSELHPGELIEIGWSPNRLVTLEYLGDSTFEVKVSRNSKLAIGDRFVTGCFIMHQPLYLPYITRNGENTMPFVAGRNGGLNIIRQLNKDNKCNKDNKDNND